MEYTLEYSPLLSHEDDEIILKGINDEAFLAKKMKPMEPLALLIKDKEGQTKGGLKAFTYYGCLYVDSLWIERPWRHLKLGTKLMLEAEEIAKKRGCTFATVTTMDWEAQGFYEKLGYSLEYTRSGYQNDSHMHILRKDLI